MPLHTLAGKPAFRSWRVTSLTASSSMARSVKSSLTPPPGVVLSTGAGPPPLCAVLRPAASLLEAMLEARWEAPISCPCARCAEVGACDAPPARLPNPVVPMAPEDPVLSCSWASPCEACARCGLEEMRVGVSCDTGLACGWPAPACVSVYIAL